nr:MAG TPA: hypothetical protein [Caudoviricetes sp.]
MDNPQLSYFKKIKSPTIIPFQKGVVLNNAK